MLREYYLELAKKGLRFPIGADLVLKEHSDHEAIRLDGVRLGKVLAEAAQRFKTPFAMPVMDLMLEKELLLTAMGGVATEDIPTYHFHQKPTAEQIETARKNLAKPLTGHLKANVDAIKYVAKHTDFVPCGMCIGPFSLTTKLLADPITPVYMAGAGMTAEDCPDVALLETAQQLALETIMRSLAEQVKAGAKLFFIAEPAANSVYVSPRQMEQGSDVFERIIMEPLRHIKAQLDAAGVDLLFHCCGELTEPMLQAFCSLDPAILSLGSSRKLWEDARIVPNNIVLYGNLPSKKFFSDELITVQQVQEQAGQLLAKMAATGHPFMLGTECDVLSVDGCQETLMKKVMAIVNYHPTAAAAEHFAA